MIDLIAAGTAEASAPRRATDPVQSSHPAVAHSDSWGSTLAIAGLVTALMILGLVLA